MLHQIELGQREITGGGFPYGLRLMVRSLGPILHGADGLAGPSTSTLRSRRCGRRRTIRPSSGGWCARSSSTIRTGCGSPWRRTPSCRAGGRPMSARGSKRCAGGCRRPTSRRSTRARRRAQGPAGGRGGPLGPAEGRRRGRPGRRRDSPRGRRPPSVPAPGVWFSAGTNGLSYLQVVVDLPPLAPELLALLPAYCDCVTEVGSAGARLPRHPGSPGGGHRRARREPLGRDRPGRRRPPPGLVRALRKVARPATRAPSPSCSRRPSSPRASTSRSACASSSPRGGPRRKRTSPVRVTSSP